MELKSQNIPKMSKDQLYQLLVQKEISDSDRQKIKNELIKREADELFNQAQRAKKGDKNPTPAGKNNTNKKSAVRPKINSVTWVILIFLVVIASFVLSIALFN